ncbi:hypothetical protein [Azospirillum rugosum]|uniref:Uncharacterized protein n=1 Tax=Azospirillum rugosum TaxID=416170 RepID=A0ABS4SLP1_9PROT|nr:hypothetical protein [Azospirillum rugosum]MBP2293471.1 hypothetical protein [Azospirillum rugosum]MDQ0530242.1 hypothetical protein [Azospirillum rugosum]
MSCRQRQAHDTLCRDLLFHATDRLDRLRSLVERRTQPDREDMERTLDALRGLLNRVTGRIEAAHLATDDAWPFARAMADQAIEELVASLDAAEARLKRAAA